MRHQARLTARINELQTRWDQLSQLLQALQQERDHWKPGLLSACV